MTQVKSHLQKHRLKEERSKREAHQVAASGQVLAESAAAAPASPPQHAAPGVCRQGSASPTKLSAVTASPAKRHKAQHSPPEASSPVAGSFLAPPIQPTQGLQQLFWITADAAQAAGTPGLCRASALPLAVPARDITRTASSLPASAASSSPIPQQLLAAARSGSCNSSGVHVDLHQLLAVQWQLAGSIPSGPSVVGQSDNVDTNVSVTMPCLGCPPASPPWRATLEQIGTAISHGPPTTSAVAAQLPSKQPQQQPLSPLDASAFLSEDDLDFLLSLE